MEHHTKVVEEHNLREMEEVGVVVVCHVKDGEGEEEAEEDLLNI